MQIMTINFISEMHISVDKKVHSYIFEAYELYLLSFCESHSFAMTTHI